MSNVWFVVGLLLAAVVVAVSSEGPQHLPEICGLKPILRSKCPEEFSDDQCHNECILPLLMKNCHDLKPQPGKELDCEKVLSCVNGFLDQVECPPNNS